MDYLQNKGKTIITISHDMEFVAENFDRVIVMAHKNVIADGSCREIFYRSDILADARVKPPVCTEIAQKLGLKEKVLNLQELVAAVR